MSTEEERNILQDMEKKGFTLEVDVLRSLMERNWNCLPQFPYVDQQTKKIRTIDAIASPYFGAIVDEKPKLILECKTSIKPWVFFTPNALRMVTDVKGNKKQVRNESLVYSKIFMLLSLAKKHSQYESTTNINEIPEGLLDELGKTHFFKNELPFACSCHVAFRSNKEDAIDDFREAVCQTNGAYQWISFAKNSPIFLAVILRGKMFAFNESKELAQVQHVIFANMGILHEELSAMPPTVLDIITDGYFSTYLDLVGEDMETCTKAFGQSWKWRF